MKNTVIRNGWLIPGKNCGIINASAFGILQVQCIKKFSKGYGANKYSLSFGDNIFLSYKSRNERDIEHDKILNILLDSDSDNKLGVFE
jgi:hypothetical protein